MQMIIFQKTPYPGPHVILYALLTVDCVMIAILEEGAYTFISHNGTSVIDYLLTKECNFSNISQSKVLENNILSDLSPLMVSLHHDFPEEVREKWSNRHRNDFRSALIAQLSTLHNLTKTWIRYVAMY